MNTYQIINTTNTLTKRDVNHNKTVVVTYVDNMTEKQVTLKPGEVIYLKTSSLPISVHKLRLNGLIIVNDWDNVNIAKKPTKKVSIQKIKKDITKQIDEKKNLKQKSSSVVKEKSVVDKTTSPSVVKGMFVDDKTTPSE
jgi:hypothetical protein